MDLSGLLNEDPAEDSGLVPHPPSSTFDGDDTEDRDAALLQAPSVLPSSAHPRPSKKSRKKPQQQQPTPAGLTGAPPTPLANDLPDDWADNLDWREPPSEEYSELAAHPHVVAPYLQSVAASTLSSRLAGISSFSSSTTAALLSSADGATHSGGTSLSLLIEDTLLASVREREAAVLAERAALDLAKRQAEEALENQERLERKREAAREGWKKRRVNKEEKDSKDAERRRNQAEAAARRRAAKKEQKRKEMEAEQERLRVLQEEQRKVQLELEAEQERLAQEQMAQRARMPSTLSGILNNDDRIEDNDELAPPSSQGHLYDAEHMNGRKRIASSPVSAATYPESKRARMQSPLNGTHDSTRIKYEEGQDPFLPSSLSGEALHPHQLASPSMAHTNSHGQRPSPGLSTNGVSKASAAGNAQQAQPQPPQGTLFVYPEQEQEYLASVRGTWQERPNALESDRKVWATIARSSIPKVIKVQQQGLISRQQFHKRLSATVARHARTYNMRPLKLTPKDSALKARKVMREMLLHLKGNEKVQRENKRKAEKEQLEKAKREEETREAKQAARKLNFLITQTELYSHFVGSKLKTSEMEDSADTASSSTKAAPPAIAVIGEEGENGNADPTAELDFADDDESNLLSHARRNALNAAQVARDKAKKFDDTFQKEQQESKENYVAEDSDDDEDEDEEGMDEDGVSSSKKKAKKAKNGEGEQLKGLDLDEMNFQNPTMAGDVQLLLQPTMLTCQLKEYQLKGLNWLANLYEQGINGILADEMGLGKTVQSISLMAYLAEKHNIWGPFLVVAPASTLHNWQQEITRFAPALKVLPYWGNVKDRTTLRKFWNRKSLRYDRNAPFHVLVTSYQLIVTDEQYFQKVKWQYMVLDEAQAIKSSASARWKVLLGFNCRNRLLLTGTPIQNSMQELWALLHFIMPSLFDSHNEFSEWFAKDIEGNADKNGAMNEHQLRRLHMILKPFMLRRIKKNVQNELADKIELDVACDLTPRQRHMYRALRQNISIQDLMQKASSLSDDESVKRLMNLIMQFRKVCNHPELFERADVTAPFAFAEYNQSYNLNREGNNLTVQYGTNSYVDVRLPRLLYDDQPTSSQLQEDTSHINRLMSVWDESHLAQEAEKENSTFSWTKLALLDPKSVHTLAKADDAVERIRIAREQLAKEEILSAQQTISGTTSSILKASIRVPQKRIPQDPSWRYLGLPPLSSIQSDYRDYSRFARSDMRFYIDPAVAPPPSLTCSSREFAYKQTDALFDQSTRTALYGVPGETTGLIGSLSKQQLPLAPMEVPQLHKLILDSGKLAKLDELLVTLKAGGHRVLVYFQMTRMIDLMEEYLAFRQYKYLRLDGSSTISDRRDMVTDWQTKPEIFIFLLSTRAGGLGINLTAADTVIFYDSDWNPSNDAQAMDRAHRLGQTRQVTVYRLITRNTIDERILQLARNKKNVQDAVVGSSNMGTSATTATGEVKSTEVVSLLLDDEELAESLKRSEEKRLKAEMKMIDNGKRGAKAREDNKRAKEIAALAAPSSSAAPRHGWSTMEDDDDDAFGFFSNTASKASDLKNPDDPSMPDEEEGEALNSLGVPSSANANASGKAKGKKKATPAVTPTSMPGSQAGDPLSASSGAIAASATGASTPAVMPIAGATADAPLGFTAKGKPRQRAPKGQGKKAQQKAAAAQRAAGHSATPAPMSGTYGDTSMTSAPLTPQSAAMAGGTPGYPAAGTPDVDTMSVGTPGPSELGEMPSVSSSAASRRAPKKKQKASKPKKEEQPEYDEHGNLLPPKKSSGGWPRGKARGPRLPDGTYANSIATQKRKAKAEASDTSGHFASAPMMSNGSHGYSHNPYSPQQPPIYPPQQHHQFQPQYPGAYQHPGSAQGTPGTNTPMSMDARSEAGSSSFM